MNPEVHLEVQFTSVFRLYLERPTSLPCDFILFHLLKVVVMNPEMHLVVQFTSDFRLYLRRPTSLPLQNDSRLEKCSAMGKYFEGVM